MCSACSIHELELLCVDCSQELRGPERIRFQAFSLGNALSGGLSLLGVSGLKVILLNLPIALLGAALDSGVSSGLGKHGLLALDAFFDASRRPYRTSENLVEGRFWPLVGLLALAWTMTLVPVLFLIAFVSILAKRVGVDSSFITGMATFLVTLARGLIVAFLLAGYYGARVSTSLPLPVKRLRAGDP